MTKPKIGRFRWNDEKKARLEEMWNAGRLTEEIVDDLGCISREAVWEQRLRQGLPARSNGSSRKVDHS